MSIAPALNANAASPASKFARVSGQKRKVRPSDEEIQSIAERTIIDDAKIAKSHRTYTRDSKNQLLANVIAWTGTEVAATDAEESKKVTHEFTNTHCPPFYKAMNQRASGRCWIYAFLNTLRPTLMKRNSAHENIDFSAAYIFFWDKWERSRTYLLRILETLDLPDSDRTFQTIQGGILSDGGMFQYAVDLVNKYGLVPESAMPDSKLASYSQEMNEQLETRLKTVGFQLRTTRMTSEQRSTLIDETMQFIYNDLVKCLGAPPNEFEWTLCISENVYVKFHANPNEFLEETMPKFESGFEFKLDDYVLITHMPNLQVNKLYEIKNYENIYGGTKVQMLNVSERDFETGVYKQVIYSPVWIGIDTKHFSYINESIAPEVLDTTKLFDPMRSLTKGQRIQAGIAGAHHAVTICGTDLDGPSGLFRSLQVENSWRDWHLDGFVFMSREGFLQDCMEAGVLKSVLPERLQVLFDSEPIVVDPWDLSAKALMIPGMPPDNIRYGQQRITRGKAKDKK